MAETQTSNGSALIRVRMLHFRRARGRWKDSVASRGSEFLSHTLQRTGKELLDAIERVKHQQAGQLLIEVVSWIVALALTVVLAGLLAAFLN